MEFERGNQLKGYIQREIKRVPMHSNYGFNYYFCRAFLERLYNEDKTAFVLKGSFSQFSTLRTYVRPLTDIDIITSRSISDAIDLVGSTLQKSNDISFKIKQVFTTTNFTVNYKLLCLFDTIQHSISIDIRKENNIKSEATDLPKLFSRDVDLNVSSVSLEEHLANKLYVALLNLELYDKLGKKYRRLKDIYDIYSILSIGNIDSKLVIQFLFDKMLSDEVLSKYSLKGKLFDKDFVLENEMLWENSRREYEFCNNVELGAATETLNEYVSNLK